MFQFAELTEVMRQGGDTKFIDFLNKIRVGNIDEDAQKQIRERFIEESYINYPENAQLMFAENYPTVKHNRKLPGKTCIINAIDQIPAVCKYPETLISLAHNKRQSETGGLAKCLELKVGAKVMATVNFGIQDMLINGQIGEVVGFEIMNSILKKVYLKFQDTLVERNRILSDHFAQQSCFVPSQKCDADIPICKGSISPSIKRTQFPIMLPWACTIHKVQGSSLEEGIVNFDFQKQRTFGQDQVYTALSRVSSYDKLFCVEKFGPSSIKVSVSALQEFESLRQNSIFENIEKIIVPDDSITILLLNVRSLSNMHVWYYRN